MENAGRQFQRRRYPARANDGRIVTDNVVDNLVLTAAQVAKGAYSVKGCGQKGAINLAAAGALAAGLLRNFGTQYLVSWMSERKSSKSPSLVEGCSFGVPCYGGRRLLVLSDPVECARELELATHLRQRASSVLLALAPDGSVPRLDARRRALKIGLPPGIPAGPGGIQPGTPPSEIIRVVRRQRRCAASDIVVTILNRTWNDEAAENFAAAGATVKRIRSGDFEAHIQACFPPVGKQIHVSYGIGRIAQGILAAPVYRYAGARLLVQPINNEGAGEAVYDEQSLVASDDCILASAGITQIDGTETVPGIRFHRKSQTLLVSVVVTSPMLLNRHRFCVAFAHSPSPRLVASAVEERTAASNSPNAAVVIGSISTSQDAALVLQFLSNGQTIETRLVEKQNSVVEFFQWWSPRIPGVSLTDSELIEVLHELEDAGKVERTETPTGDTCEYVLTWRAC